MGMSGVEHLIANAVTKALENPAIVEKLTSFMGLLETHNMRMAAIETKLDRVLVLLESDLDPSATNAVLDHIALFSDGIGEGLPESIGNKLDAPASGN